MSRTLKFYGCSDDLFEIEGTHGDEPDEIGCYDKPCVVKIQSGDDALCVVGMYAPGNVAGCWSIGLMPVDEDREMPNWPVTYKLGGRGYSTELTMSVPDNAVVTVYKDTL